MKAKFQPKYYYSIVKDDFSQIVDAILFYEKVLEEAPKDLAVLGDLEKMIQEQPGLEAIYNGIHDDCAALTEFLSIQIEYEDGKEYKRLQSQEGRQEYGELKATDLKNYILANDDLYENKKFMVTLAYYKKRLATICSALKSKAYALNGSKEMHIAGLSSIFVDATRERV